MRAVDRARVEAFEAVLRQPFELDFQRGSRLTQPGRPDRYDTTLPALLTRWAQRRRIDRGLDTGAATPRRVLQFAARRRA